MADEQLDFDPFPELEDISLDDVHDVVMKLMGSNDTDMTEWSSNSTQQQNFLPPQQNSTAFPQIFADHQNQNQNQNQNQILNQNQNPILNQNQNQNQNQLAGQNWTFQDQIPPFAQQKIGIATKIGPPSVKSAMQFEASSPEIWNSSSKIGPPSVKPSMQFEASSPEIWNSSSSPENFPEDDFTTVASDDDAFDRKSMLGRRSVRPGERPPQNEDEKRLAHNRIEKRYRETLNEKIEELKRKVITGRAQMSKAAILQRTIDYIDEIRKQNKQLRTDNIRLRHTLERMTMGYPPVPSPVNLSQQPMQTQNFVNIKGKVVPLMAFLLGVLLFNPFHLFQFSSSSGGVETHANQRTLLWIPDVSSWPNLIPWVLMTIFAILWLISRRNSKTRGIPDGAYPGEASRQLSEAINDLNKQDLASAEFHLMECKRLMKIPEINQKFSFLSFAKEIFVHLLYTLEIRQVGSTAKHSSLGIQAELLHATLHQITEKTAKSVPISKLFFWLNSADQSGIPLIIAKAYLLAIWSIPDGKLKTYLIWRLQNSGANDAIPWLKNRIVGKFLNQKLFFKRTANFTIPGDKHDVLEIIQSQLKIWLLEKFLKNLQKEEKKREKLREFLSFLNQICHSTNGKLEDEICLWWTRVLFCMLEWESTESNAKALYSKIRKMPEILAHDSIALVLGHGFCIHKLQLENLYQPAYAESIWKHCISILTELNSVDFEELSDLEVRFLRYGLEWALEGLQTCFGGQIENNSNDQKIPNLYESLIENYQRLPPGNKRKKAKIFESVHRNLQRANPIRSKIHYDGQNLTNFNVWQI